MPSVERYVPDFSIKMAPAGSSGQMRDLLTGRALDILSVSITETVNRADTFSFTLRSSHKQLERFPNGNDLLWIDDQSLQLGTEVTIELGYLGNRAVKMVGTVRAVNISFTDSGLITLRVDGQSLYAKMFDKRRRKPFADNTDSAIASAIASELGLSPRVKATTVEYPTVSNRDSDLASILQARAERLYYELTVKEKTLYFEPPPYIDNNRAALQLKWGESLLNFSPRINMNGMPTSVEVRNSRTSHGGSTKPIVAKIDAGSVKACLGSRSGPQIAKDLGRQKVILSNDQKVTTPEDAKAVAIATLRRHAIQFIEGQAATIGDPQLVSRKVIELQGLGRQLTGLYYVTSTTHSIDGGGYRTNFQVNRDGI